MAMKNKEPSKRWDCLAFIIQLIICVYIALVTPFVIAGYEQKHGQPDGSPIAEIFLFIFFVIFGWIYIVLDYYLAANPRNNLEFSGNIINNKERNLKRAYRTFKLMRGTYILGTFVAAMLWFIRPENPHLEPLTILLGYGTILAIYFHKQLTDKHPRGN